MCEYCGCREVPAIAELMDEHTALMEQAHLVRQDLGAGDDAAAMARLRDLVTGLDRHMAREEAGIFRAIRSSGEFVDEIDALEGEHRDFSVEVAALAPGTPGLADRVRSLLDDLGVHVEREDLGIFPVSVVTLGATGWAVVEAAHEDSPSFLHDTGTHPLPPT